MKYLEPRVRLDGPATGWHEKFGGLPQGLAVNLWPTCVSCGVPQTLLCELADHGELLPLGDRVLLVFKCEASPGNCDDSIAGSGCNAVLLVPRSELGTELTPPPSEATPVLAAFAIVRWTAADDGIADTLRDAYEFNDGDDELDLDDDYISPPDGTRIGSVPHWLQDESEGPGRTHRFVLQLADVLGDGPAPDAPGVQRGRRGWSARGPNFGGGIGMVFLPLDPAARDGVFLWQR